jgi:hypothetical protein
LKQQMHGSRVSAGARCCRAAILACCAILCSSNAISGEASRVPTLAVFNFELEDESAAGAPSGEPPADVAVLADVTRNAIKTLADSGKYRLIDTTGADTEAVRTRTLRNCDGCEAGVARQLGAELSLLGVLRKVEQAAYAIEIQIRDATTGQVVFGQRGVFLGGTSEWSSGVRSLLRHELLRGRWTWNDVAGGGGEPAAGWSYEAAVPGPSP